MRLFPCRDRSAPHKVVTAFPKACPCLTWRIAEGTSLSGQVLSLAGLIFPDSMSSFGTATVSAAAAAQYTLTYLNGLAPAA